MGIWPVYPSWRSGPMSLPCRSLPAVGSLDGSGMWGAPFWCIFNFLFCSHTSSHPSKWGSWKFPQLPYPLLFFHSMLSKAHEGMVFPFEPLYSKLSICIMGYAAPKVLAQIQSEIKRLEYFCILRPLYRFLLQSFKVACPAHLPFLC